MENLQMAEIILKVGVAFCLLILFHELGHFLVAKYLGIGVERFSIGFGPKIASFRRGETEYMLSVIPLGGYVKLLGDDPRGADGDHPRAFLNKSIGQRMAVVAAGPLANFALAIVIFAGIHWVGVPTPQIAELPEVGEVVADSPAQQAGLQKGDRILAVDGKAVSKWEELVQTIHQHINTPLRLEVQRGTDVFGVTVTPKAGKVIKDLEEVEVGLIGVAPQVDFTVVRYALPSALWKGVEKTWELSALTVMSLVKMVQGKISPRHLAGPVGIFQMAGQQAKVGLLPLISLVAVLSISLGILNLFPIPVLDGGHILFFAVEGLWGQPISPRKQEIATQVGLFLLVALMLTAFYNDLLRIFAN
ncbi:MAG TPA: RIP metalloprotease RseP [Candidatus Tectomicrobia bacterium]|nr:RIP metalloprotease RseP [Candidatus Tectomicrobia bacterium]